MLLDIDHETLHVDMPGRGTAPESCWIQDAAFLRLRKWHAPSRKLPSSWAAYCALVIAASDTESEPGPKRDGRWFEATLERLGEMIDVPASKVGEYLDDFVNLGMLDWDRHADKNGRHRFRVLTLNATAPGREAL